MYSNTSPSTNPILSLLLTQPSREASRNYGLPWSWFPHLPFTLSLDLVHIPQVTGVTFADSIKNLHNVKSNALFSELFPLGLKENLNLTENSLSSHLTRFLWHSPLQVFLPPPSHFFSWSLFLCEILQSGCFLRCNTSHFLVLTPSDNPS